MKRKVMEHMNRTEPLAAIGRIRTHLHGAALGDPMMWRRDEGQATVEYALVVLAAAAIALLLVAWAARSGKIGELFDSSEFVQTAFRRSGMRVDERNSESQRVLRVRGKMQIDSLLRRRLPSSSTAHHSDISG